MGEFGDVQEFLRRAIRARRVENKAAAITDDVGDELRKLGNGNVLSRSNVEEFGSGIVFQDEDASIGKVINRKKFPAWSAGAPYRHGWCVSNLGFMETTDQCCRNVAVLRMIVITRPVEVGWHNGDEICAVLLTKSLYQFNARDFGHRVPLIGRLEWSGKQHVLVHRLRG